MTNTCTCISNYNCLLYIYIYIAPCGSLIGLIKYLSDSIYITANVVNIISAHGEVYYMISVALWDKVCYWLAADQ